MHVIRYYTNNINIKKLGSKEFWFRIKILLYIYTTYTTWYYNIIKNILQNFQ